MCIRDSIGTVARVHDRQRAAGSRIQHFRITGVHIEARNVRANVIGERRRGEIENALYAEPIDIGLAGIEKSIRRLHIDAGRRWRTVC